MILDEIAEKTRERYRLIKTSVPPDKIKEKALSLNPDTGFPFRNALLKDGLSFICEVKRASPSKGIIAGEFDYIKTATEYESAGAAAVSVLTEPYYFKGSDKYLLEIAQSVSIPVLRKDFTIDEYQIYESRVLGASCILLICALLDTQTLKRFISTAESLGMDAIVEVHSREEIKSAEAAGAMIIGINNRDLTTFNVDLNKTGELACLVPDSKILISESGIKTREDIQFVKSCKADAVLIGETLMRSADKKKTLEELNL
ncbi:indole-3-glycerol phosphate synthase TrpC [Lachnospiraceae bacterium NSJ-143]|nr:indole-3-glycerol phosphate synthase TrpC [Lachnospiraceae bacterium NSJ-143]